MKRQKGKAFHLHSKYQDVSLYLESSSKYKGGWQEDPSTPCSQSATTNEQGHLQVKDPLFSWFSSLTDKNFNTETPDKKLQHLHKALNINELLRAAFALWACTS